MLWTLAVILIVLWLLGDIEQSHDVRIYSHPAGSCYYHGVSEVYSGATSDLNLFLTTKPKDGSPKLSVVVLIYSEISKDTTTKTVTYER